MIKNSLPMGIDSFRKLREGGCYYHDKTMLIADFLESGAEVTLITRPRRFGKTLNMDMVKEFFDIATDSGSIFEGLAIMNTTHREQMNTRPVISFSFRNCKGGLLPLVLSMKDELLREYERYQDIAKPIGKIDEIQYDQMLSCLLSGQADTAPLGKAISFLSKLVSQHYGKNPLILMDEYDTPMTSAYTEGCYDELRQFFTTLFGSALKGNPYLDKALLTGIQRIAKENIFSGLNNLVVCGVNDQAYSGYFGFHPEEAQKLLADYDMELTEGVKELYDGYRIGNQELYNPWSLLSYVNSGKLMPYWVNTSSNALIRKCVLSADSEFIGQFDELILKGSVKVVANLQTSFFEISNNGTLWGMLMNAGYITVIQELEPFTGFCEVRIPNREVRSEFQAMVAERTKLGEVILSEMFYYLIHERNLEKFTSTYQRIVLTVTSYYDAKENAYHMLMLGMCVYLNSAYEITSNLEAGFGRSDITLRAKQKGRPHIIMEFKQGENLEQLSEEALRQIEERQYFAGLSGEVLLMGIAHDKKRCEIRSKVQVLGESIQK